ncbi:MAG: GIY-YIG nuclease family protein [Acidobacteria bacterium]|nr:GIY-YIG nuclease family protein [Acidobacteriota bacterium]
MVRCRDGSLYTGIASDVSRRFTEHQQSSRRSAKYLRCRRPLRLVLNRSVGGRGAALRIEHLIKRMSKTRKEALITQDNLMDQLIERTAGRDGKRRKYSSSQQGAKC